MVTDYDPLNDRLRQFDLYLTDLQEILEKITLAKIKHEKDNPSQSNKYKNFYDSLFFKIEELFCILIDIEKD